MKLFASMCLAVGCIGSAQAQSEDTDAAPARDLEAVVAEILRSEATAEDYDESKRCISKGRISRSEVLGDRFVVFHMRGDEKYMVQFDRRCPGLERNGTLRLETSSLQLCAMDTIQGLFEMGVGRGHWGPRCMIPGFEPVTAEQVTLIKEELAYKRVR